MKRMGLVILLLLTGIASFASEVPKDDFVKAAEAIASSINEYDHELYRTTLAEAYFQEVREEESLSPKEWKEDWVEGTRQMLSSFGRIEAVEFIETDPPDGAFFTIRHDHGAGEIFLTLDEEGKITRLNMRPLNSCAASGSHDKHE